MSSIPNSAMPHAGASSADSQRSATSNGNRPSDYRSDTFAARERGSGSLLDRARENKTGIAVGVAVGAIAAAAIPFMLSGKKRSNGRRNETSTSQLDVYVDARDSSSGDRTGTRY